MYKTIIFLTSKRFVRFPLFSHPSAFLCKKAGIFDDLQVMLAGGTYKHSHVQVNNPWCIYAGK